MVESTDREEEALGAENTRNEDRGGVSDGLKRERRREGRDVR